MSRVVFPSRAPVALLALTVGIAAWGIPEGASGQADAAGAVTQAQFDRWWTELSNWGRWGPGDELGALNLITPEKRRQSAALVRDGVSVSLSLDASYERIVDNRRAEGVSDRLVVSYHGGSDTHIDALAHRFYRGKMWNGVAREKVTEKDGAEKNSIHNVQRGIFTRGVLMDIPRLKGVPHLEPGSRIYPEDLEAWEKQTGITVSAGDAVFIRTGRWARADATPPQGEPGLDARVIPWLKQRDVALLGSEHWQDAPPLEGMHPLPVHDFALIALGIHLFDNCALDAVAEEAASRGRWEFLLTVAPLRVPGGTGSPVNPIATF